MNDLKVRELKESDIPYVISLGVEMHQEGAFRVASFSTEKVNKIFNACLVSDKYLCLVAEDGDEIMGFYVAIIAQDWFSEDSVSKDMALYVAPSYRSKGVAKLLIKEYVLWAEKKKVVSIGAGTNSGINSEGVKRLYESFDFYTVGYVFRKRL